MDGFAGKRVSVIGAGRSGAAAAAALARLGAQVRLSDSKPVTELDTTRIAEVEAAGVAFLPEADVVAALPEGTELVVTSPGVPRTAAVLQTAVQRSIPVWSEIELAYRLTEKPILAVTGTNGKTTTTLLLAAMLQSAGFAAVAAGNISADALKRTLVEAALPDLSVPPTQKRELGRDASAFPNEERAGREGLRGANTAVANWGEEMREAGLLVAEVSSFQLEWVERFAPHVGILTNITPDHLNRHASFAEYAQTKARLFAAQTGDDWAVVNYDNPAARQIGQSGLRARRVWFTREGSPPEDGPAAWLRDGVLTARLQEGASPIALLHQDDLPPTLPGAHSVENALAAAVAALVVGADAEAVAAAVREFPGVAHRMEFVAEIAGVRYINNSMCTNVAAAVNSLEALDRPAIVIAGGADKQLDFAPLTPALQRKARHLILIGAAAAKMEETFRAGGYTAVRLMDSLEAAAREAQRLAQPGDVVLLSPGCASFDMFRDFEARGEAFRQVVRALQEEVR